MWENRVYKLQKKDNELYDIIINDPELGDPEIIGQYLRSFHSVKFNRPINVDDLEKIAQSCLKEYDENTI